MTKKTKIIIAVAVVLAVLGGIAVFFGMTVALVVTRLAFDTHSLFAVMGVMAIMFYLGTMDDILSLSPRMRFIVEIMVILLLIFCNKYSLNDFHGLWGIYQIPDSIELETPAYDE